MSVTYSGPLPAEIDPRLERRDVSPLPADVLIRVQAINRGKNPQHNQRFMITRSGDVFAAGHSGDTSDWQTPFDQPFPSVPARRLEPERLHALRALLESGFAAEPAYTADQTVEDGLFLVITARTGAGTHEAIYEAVQPSLVKEILELTAGDS